MLITRATIRAPTLWSLILSHRNFSRRFVRLLPSRKCAVSLLFFLSRFINSFIVKNNIWNRKFTKILNISRSIYFKEISAYRFEDFICTNKSEEFFFKKIFFQVLGAFYTNVKPLKKAHQNVF